MRKILLTLGLLAVAGTSMASEMTNAMSAIASGGNDENSQSVTVEKVNSKNETDNVPIQSVNLEYRYIEVNGVDMSNSIDKNATDGKTILDTEFKEFSDITKFVSNYGVIKHDDSFVNEMVLNDNRPTMLAYQNNKTRESTKSKIYLYMLKDQRIMASVDFRFEKPTESGKDNKEKYDNISSHYILQRFSLKKNGNYKLVSYSSSDGKAYFIYMKAYDLK